MADELYHSSALPGSIPMDASGMDVNVIEQELEGPPCSHAVGSRYDNLRMDQCPRADQEFTQQAHFISLSLIINA